MYASTTTLNRIRAERPWVGTLTKLLAGLGKAKADDEPLDLLTIHDILGFDSALWVLTRAMPDDRLARHFQAWCAEHVLHFFEAARPGDMRIRDQIAMLRNDDATSAERYAAWINAWRAAVDAADNAASGAASDAAMTAISEGAFAPRIVWDAIGGFPNAEKAVEWAASAAREAAREARITSGNARPDWVAAAGRGAARASRYTQERRLIEMIMETAP